MCYKRKYLAQVGFVVKETSLIQKQPSTWVLQLPRSCTRHDLVALRIRHVTNYMCYNYDYNTLHSWGLLIRNLLSGRI